MRTDAASYDLFSAEEKQFLERMFAEYPHIGDKFDRYLALPADERRALAEQEAGTILRSGWVRRQVPAPESVLDHIRSLMALVRRVAPTGVDINRLERMASVHDLPEGLVTDFTPHDTITIEDKDRLEGLAARVLFVAEPEAVALVEEYCVQETSLSHLLHDFDKLDAVARALHYEGRYPEKLMGKLYRDFADYATPRLKTEAGKAFASYLEANQDALRLQARGETRGGDRQLG